MTYNRSATTRNRNSWDPTTTVVATTRGCLKSIVGEEYAEEYTERMVSAQLRQLDPLKEDLADWLNKTLDNVVERQQQQRKTQQVIEYINRDNFLTELSNGVVLFHLAQVIQESAKCSIAKGLIKGPSPDLRDKCFEKARRGSFFSRDNVENFIKFCRSLGVHENLLFESEDLVLNKNARNVILCLLEVARIATRFGVEPPGLVQLEKEIAEEERIQSADSGLGSLLSWQFQAATPMSTTDNKMRLSNSASAISSLSTNPSAVRWNTGPHLVLVPDVGAGGDNSTNVANTLIHRLPAPSAGASDGVPSDHTEEEDEWSRGSGEDPDDVDDVIDGVRRAALVQEPPPSPEVNVRPTSAAAGLIMNGSGDNSMTELDRKVQLATRLMQNSCRCSKERCSNMPVKKVGEGKYNIAGRNVFVRLLKGRHMMVRVGGGWDTLDHFLLRHDPCQVKVVSRSNVSSNGNIGNNAPCYDTITGTGTGGSSTCSSSSPTSPTSPIMYIADSGSGGDRGSSGKYLHIRAKYRSPPPRENCSVAR